MHKVLRISLVLVVIMALGVYALNSVVNGADDLTPAERMKQRLQKAADEAYLKGNLDALDEYIDPDVVMHMPYRADAIGIDAFKETIKQNRLILSELRLILDELFLSGDRVILQFTLQGVFAREINQKWVFQNKETGESETIGVSLSAGKKVTSKGCVIFRTVNGKIVESWQYEDSMLPTLIAAGIKLAVKPMEE